MTDDSGEKDSEQSKEPGEGDAGGQDLERESQDPTAPRLSARELRQRLRGLIAGEVTSQMTADDSPSRASVIFQGKGIGAEGGNAGTIGRLMVALERYFDALNADVLMTGLRFGNSVELFLETRVTATEAFELEELQKVEDPAAITQERLERAIPSSVVNLEAAARILDEPSSRIADYAGALSAGAVTELRKLSDALYKDQASLRLRSVARTEVSIGPKKAKAVSERLREPIDIGPRKITVVGLLSRTDSDAGEFRVVLDRSLQPVELDGRRRHVEGPYTAHASDQVRENGLWDKRVIAEVTAEFVAPPGGGRPRPDRFTFTDVQLSST